MYQFRPSRESANVLNSQIITFSLFTDYRVNIFIYQDFWQICQIQKCHPRQLQGQHLISLN